MLITAADNEKSEVRKDMKCVPRLSVQVCFTCHCDMTLLAIAKGSISILLALDHAWHQIIDLWQYDFIPLPLQQPKTIKENVFGLSRFPPGIRACMPIRHMEC